MTCLLQLSAKLLFIIINNNEQYGQSVVLKDKTLSAGGIRTHNHVGPKSDAPHY